MRIMVTLWRDARSDMMLPAQRAPLMLFCRAPLFEARFTPPLDARRGGAAYAQDAEAQFACQRTAAHAARDAMLRERATPPIRRRQCAALCVRYVIIASAARRESAPACAYAATCRRRLPILPACA